MKRRKWWAIILTAALLLSMTACGGGDKKGETAPSAGGETKEKAGETQGEAAGAEDSKKGVELICWTILNPESDGDPRNIAFKKIVEDWNATNEWGAKMNVVSVNWADLHTQFTQAAAAGNAPDVVCAFSTNLDQYIAAGGLQPMTQYATEWINKTDDYIYTA